MKLHVKCTPQAAFDLIRVKIAPGQIWQFAIDTTETPGYHDAEMTETQRTVAHEIERYLRTGESDPYRSAWSGGFLQREERAHGGRLSLATFSRSAAHESTVAS